MDPKGKGKAVVRIEAEPAPATKLAFQPGQDFRPAVQQTPHRIPPPARARVNWNDRRVRNLIAANVQDPGPSNWRATEESRLEALTLASSWGASRRSSPEQTLPVPENVSQQPSRLLERSSREGTSPEKPKLPPQVLETKSLADYKVQALSQNGENVGRTNGLAPLPQTQRYPAFGEFPGPPPQNLHRPTYAGNGGNSNVSTSAPINPPPDRTPAGQYGHGLNRGGRAGNRTRGRAHQFLQNQQQPTIAPSPGNVSNRTSISTRGRGCFPRNCKCGIHHPPVDERGNIVRPARPTQEQLARHETCDRQLSTVVRITRTAYSGKPAESGQFLGKHPDYHHETSEAAYPDLEDTFSLIRRLKLPTDEERQTTNIERAESIRNSIDTLGYQIDTFPQSTDMEALTDEDLRACFYDEFWRLLEILEEVHGELPANLRPFPRRQFPEFVSTVLFTPQESSPQGPVLAQNPTMQNEAPMQPNSTGCLICADSPCICVGYNQGNNQSAGPSALRPDAPEFMERDENAIQGDRSGCDCIWCEDGYPILCLLQTHVESAETSPQIPAAVDIQDLWTFNSSEAAATVAESTVAETTKVEATEIESRCAFCMEVLCLTCNMGVDSPGEGGDSANDSEGGDNNDGVRDESDSEDGGADENNEDGKERRPQDEPEPKDKGPQPPKYPRYLKGPEAPSKKKAVSWSTPAEDQEYLTEIALKEYMRSLIDLQNTEEAQLPRLPSSPQSDDFTEDWTTARLHSTVGSSSSTVDLEKLETSPTSESTDSADRTAEKGENSAIASKAREDLSYLFTYTDMTPGRPTSPLALTTYWDPAIPASTMRNPFRCLGQPTTRNLEANRVRNQTQQAMLCVLCIIEKDWEQYAEIYFSMMPYGDGWRYIHARHMRDFFGEGWFGEHDLAYRLGSMSGKMERRVEIFKRPAWDVEHNYL